MNKEDSADSAITKWDTKYGRMNSAVRKMRFSYTMRLRPRRTWKVASQTGGETKARHPISNLLSAKIIFSKRNH